jgi:glycosyltransferase involved in cell wall biosynthesis
MKHILIIGFTDIENDPRVRRQVEALSRHYRVTTIGWEPAKIPGVEFFQILPEPHSGLNRLLQALRLKMRRFERVYRKFYNYPPLLDKLRGQSFDLIIANDIETLPFAFELGKKNQPPVICDAHEYAPAQFDQQFKWRFLYKPYNRYLCQAYLPRCAHVFTVSPGIAGEYRRQFGVRPTVLTNATEYRDLEPSPTSDDHIRLIHHGSAQPSRKIERMIEAMKYTGSRFSLDLMLIPGGKAGYLEQLNGQCRQMPHVNLIPPVPMLEIPETISSYDAGIYFLEPVNFNYRMALPNKIFEFIQARLAVITGPTQCMAELVEKYECGIIVNSFDPREIADKLNKLTTAQIKQYKQKSHQAAKELNAEKNMKQLELTVKKLLTT